MKTRLIIFINCLGIFLCMLDTTVMNIALPSIQSGLNVSLTNLSWALNIYTILFATLTIPLSRLAENLGITKFYMLGLLLFGVGSLTSGIASSLSILIFGRAIQSIGAAVVFPLSMTIGISNVSLKKRNSVIAALGVTQGLAAALGPVIGGIITQYLTWRWIFFINLPIIIIAILISFFCLDTHEEKKRYRIDIFGSTFSVIFLFTLTLVLIKGRDWGWSSTITLITSLISFIFLILFIWIEFHVVEPMIPMKLFSYRQFTGSSIAIILSNLFLVAITVVLPTFFTKLQNKTELEAALLITPISLMIFIVSPLSAFLLEKLGPRLIILTGFMSMAFSYYLFSSINMTDLLMVVISCISLGIGYGMIAGPITVLSAANFKGTLLTASQSVSGVFRQIGTVLAVAIFVTGLYSNLSKASSSSKTFAQNQIIKLDMPKTQQQKMLKTTEAAISTGNSKISTPQSHFSKTQINELTKTKYSAIVQKHSFSPTQRRFLYKKVHSEVKKNTEDWNKKINRVIKRIKVYSTSKFEHAFSQLYLTWIPVILLSSLISFLFLRKREYKKSVEKNFSNSNSL